MSGIEPAVYAGLMAVAAIIGIAWKFYTFMRSETKTQLEPIERDLTKAKAEIKQIGDDFLEFRLEVSRTYTTKEDVFNANKPVLDGVERLSKSVDHMTTRIDRVIEQSNAAKPATRRRSTE